MAKTTLFHERDPKTKYYHDNDECPEGKKIPQEKVRPGGAGNLLCPTCAKLSPH